jgi:hypothetical protein
MRRVWATAVVLALCAGVLVAGAGLAGAKSRKANSKVTLGVGFLSGTGTPFFQGSVSSGRHPCTIGRTITIVFQRNKNRYSFIGRTRTDSTGGYSLPMHSGMPVGGYFARTKKTSRCKFGQSGGLAFSNNDTTASGRALRWMRRHR